MKKIKILIIYFPILSSFFGLSYKKENKLVPNEYKYNSNNSLFYSNLEERKELKHNSFKQCNNQNKKNYENFSFQYENKYNKKNENKKASNLFTNESPIKLSFGTSLISPYFAPIKGDNPHISKIYNIKGEKKSIDLNSPTYSFTQSKSLVSIHNDVISDYNNLIKMINENYYKAKDAYIYSNSYHDMSRYFVMINNKNFGNCLVNTYPKITNLSVSANNSIIFYEEVKKDMRKRINHLQLLERENGKRSLYENELLQFKKKIEENKRNANVYITECEKKRKDAFNDLKKYLVLEVCPNHICNKAKTSYKKALQDYLSVDKVNKDTYSESLKVIEDYFNNQNLLLKLMEGNFSEKKVKYDLILLMEEINDIKEIYKKHTQIIRDSIRDLKNYDKNAEKKQFTENSVAEDLIASSHTLKKIVIYNIWNTQLTTDFNKKKGEYDNLFKTESQKLGKKISKLVYPESVILESKQIISNSQGILTDVKRINDEHFEKLENLLYNCDSSEFSAIKKELTQLYAELTVHNTSIKNKFDSMNEIYISITNEKPKIENKKKNILEKGDILNMITRDVLIKKKEIEDIIASSSDNLNLLKRNYEELKNLKGKIENLKIQVQTKKNKLKELKRQEESRKEESIKKIREKLEEIKKKIEDFKPVINLKDSENEDLKFIEKLIYDKPFNKNEFIEKKKKAHEQINLALNSLFGNGLIDELKKISQFVAEKEVLNYKELRLSRIIEILDEIMKMSSKVNKIISDAMSTLENKVNPAKKNIIELKNYIITKSIEDLHIKMENSIDNFSRMSNELSENITDYETKKKTLENYENDIKMRKNELLSNIINENILFEKKDISQDILDLERISSNVKNKITKQISDKKVIISSIKEQLELYKKLEKYFDICKDTSIINKFKTLKKRIDQTNIDNKLNEYQTKFDSLNRSMENSINMINFYNAIIEYAKILNNIISESNKNNTLITSLRKKLDALKSKVNDEIFIINEDNLIENNEKTKFLNKLREKEGNIEEKIKQINDIEERSNKILDKSKDLKNKVGNAPNLENVKTFSKDISDQNINLNNITDEINKIKLVITTLDAEVDNIINIQNDEIINLVYNIIFKLNKEINEEVQRNLEVLEVTQNNIKSYNFENDMKKIEKEHNRETLRTTIQTINNIMNQIDANKNKFIDMRNESNGHVDASNNQKNSEEDSKEKKKSIKKIYEKVKQIYERLNTVKEESQISLIDINEKILDYKKILIRDAISQITDKKKKAEEDIATIELFKKKIEQLKENTGNISESELKSFNYEDYVNSAKESNSRIQILEQEAISINKKLSSITSEDDINRIKIDTEQKLKNSEKEKCDINHALSEIKNMEKLLMSTKFSSIMEDIEKNTKKTKQEKENVKEQFTLSEGTKEEITTDFKKAEELRDLLISTSDENSIDRHIDDIKIIKDRIEANIGKINEVLIVAEQHKEASKLYYHNTKRGKNKIDYLKNHDQHEEKKITENVINQVNIYVNESESYFNEADMYSQGTTKNYELLSPYKENMDNLLNESLIIAEKIKIEMKKKNLNDIRKQIQDDYYNIQRLIEKLKEKLNMLKGTDSNIKEKEEANNEKSKDVLSRIQIIRTNVTNDLFEIEMIKQNALDIFNDSEIDVESMSIKYETNEENLLDKLRIEQRNLKNITEILKKFEDLKIILRNETNRLKIIDTRTNGMESEMEILKKKYEEGILEEIKKIADKEKHSITSIKKSINLNIETAVSFFLNSLLKENDITKKHEASKRKMNEISDAFDKSYNAIENYMLNILENSTTYEKAKEQKERAKTEKENLIEKRKEMENLLDNIEETNKNETMQLISYLKEELNKINEKSKEEYLGVKNNLDDIKIIGENIKNIDDPVTALSELNISKNKDNEIKTRKDRYSFYKSEVDVIYNGIVEAVNFLNTFIETESRHQEIINDTKEIVESMLKFLDDINKKEKESELIIIEAGLIYEQIKFKDELKKKIKEKNNEADNILSKIQEVHEKIKKIKEINVDIENYNETLTDHKKNHEFKELMDSYKEKLSRMKNELEIDTIKSEIHNIKDSLNNLEESLGRLQRDTSATTYLEKIEHDIDVITNKLNNTHENILEINTSFDELLELGQNCRLSLKSLIVTIINVEISEGILFIQKKEKDATSHVEDIKNSYDALTKDINTLNNDYAQNIIRDYKSEYVQKSQQYLDEFKKKEQETMGTIDDIKKELSSFNEINDTENTNEKLQKIKHLHEKFKNDIKHINNIYNNICNIKLKEIESISKKFIEIADSHKNMINDQKQILLENSKNLKRIEDYLAKKEQELILIKPSDEEEVIQETNKIFEDITNNIKELSTLENENNNKKKNMVIYTEKILYLTERSKSILKDLELYQYEKDNNLSENENEELLNKVIEYKETIKKENIELKNEFSIILNNVEQNKEIVLSNEKIILSINDILKKLNKIKGEFEKELIKIEKKNQLKKEISNEDRRIINQDKIQQLNYKSISTPSNTKSNSQYDKDKQKSGKKNESNNPITKLAGGILGSLLAFSFAYLVIFFKNKNKEDDIETSDTAREFEDGNSLSYENTNEEVIEVSFFRGESL